MFLLVAVIYIVTGVFLFATIVAIDKDCCFNINGIISASALWPLTIPVLLTILVILAIRGIILGTFSFFSWLRNWS